MASSDYYLCDVCGRKTFYDAGLHYGHDTDPSNEYKQLPTGVGQMRVLCNECATTKKVVVIDK